MTIDSSSDGSDSDTSVMMEDDALVGELDICLHPSPDLHLFQFPNRTHGIKLANQAQFKPLAQIFQVDMPLDPSIISPESAPSFAAGLKDLKKTIVVKSEHPDMENSSFDKIPLISQSVPLNASYFTGFTHNNTFYLTPLHHIFQFRPMFKYLDEINDQEKQAKKLETEGDEPMDLDVLEEAKMVTMTMKTEDKQANEKLNQLELLKQQEEEPWLSLYVDSSVIFGSS